MSEEYTIRHLQDDKYQLVRRSSGEVVHQGSLQELNAYLDLRAKGFEEYEL